MNPASSQQQSELAPSFHYINVHSGFPSMPEGGTLEWVRKRRLFFGRSYPTTIRPEQMPVHVRTHWCQFTYDTSHSSVRPWKCCHLLALSKACSHSNIELNFCIPLSFSWEFPPSLLRHLFSPELKTTLFTAAVIRWCVWKEERFVEESLLHRLSVCRKDWAMQLHYSKWEQIC